MPEFRNATLSNGLRIAAEIDSRSYSAAYGYFVRSGSRNEVDSESGLSHFLEHMMFKGTKRRTAAMVNRELDELGGQSNAYTTEEQTVYYATVLPKFQDRILDLLTDMLSPVLDEGEFETERQVILEEIAKYEDQPPFGAFERAMELHFTPRGLGRRVLGTADSVREMSAQSMRRYFDRRYHPSNIVLAATGDVNFDEMVAFVESATAAWADRNTDDVPAPDDLSQLPVGIALDTALDIEDASQAYSVSIGKGPAISSQDRYDARVLAAIMGDEGGSRLFWDLVDTGQAELATVWPQEFTDQGAWFTYLVSGPDNIQQNLESVEKIFQDTAANGVKESELEQTINKAAAGCIMQSDRPSNRLFGVGSRWLTCQEYQSTDETLARLRAVDVNSVSAAAKKYLLGDQTHVLASASPVAS